MMNSNSSTLIGNYRTVEDKVFGSQSRPAAQANSLVTGGAKDPKMADQVDGPHLKPAEPLGRKPAEAPGSGDPPRPTPSGGHTQPRFDTAQPAPSTDEADLRT